MRNDKLKLCITNNKSISLYCKTELIMNAKFSFFDILVIFNFLIQFIVAPIISQY